MINNAHYPSLQLCKQLAKIGFKTNPDKDFYPNSELAWFGTTRNGGHSILMDCGEMEGFARYPCPSVMEMLDVIPDYISSPEDEGKGWDYVWQLLINKRVADYGYDVFYNRIIQSPFNLYNSKTDTLPNALAETILWLHENNYITFKHVSP